MGEQPEAGPEGSRRAQPSLSRRGLEMMQRGSRERGRRWEAGREPGAARARPLHTHRPAPRSFGQSAPGSRRRAPLALVAGAGGGAAGLGALPGQLGRRRNRPIREPAAASRPRYLGRAPVTAAGRGPRDGPGSLAPAGAARAGPRGQRARENVEPTRVPCPGDWRRGGVPSRVGAFAPAVCQRARRPL